MLPPLGGSNNGHMWKLGGLRDSLLDRQAVTSVALSIPNEPLSYTNNVRPLCVERWKILQDA
jgi:hypothetical protein